MHYIHTRWFKALSGIILSLFIWTFGGIYDIAQAARDGNLLEPPRSVSSIKEPSSAAKLNQAMAALEAVLEDASLTMKEKKSRVKELRDTIKDIDKELRAEFDRTAKHLKDKGLPNEIMKRQKDFVSHYEGNYDHLMSNLNAVIKARRQGDFDERSKKALEHLKKNTPEKRHEPLDPNKLPHRSAEPTKAKPRLTKDEFIDSLKAERKITEPILVASAGSLDGLLNDSEGYMKLALADGTPTDADLAETTDVKFTDAITAKAAELDHDPMKIYEWVRNNVEFVPTWGSIQGADYCLQTMECNATDTASLLIALLRASGVHARYVHGTIQVPIEKAMNWFGGFTDAYAALNFAGSGGIPEKGLAEGGTIKYIQMEHVWVEAWLDYFPSRGARHKAGGEDTWIPLDASYKQYDYTQGMDLASEVPFDADGFVNTLVSTATINEEQGYVTGIDSDYIQQAMESYQTQVSDYMAANHPDATVGDVLGTKTIVKQEFPYLLGTLPYNLDVAGARYAELPASLRHSISFSVKPESMMYYTDPLTWSASLPELAGKKITMSYAPATQVDEDVINSFLPEPNPDGTPPDLSQFPASLPAYMINLKPQLMVDGTVVAEGGAVTMGLYENMRMTFSLPTLAGETITNLVAAGEYFGVALDLGRISKGQVEKVRFRLESTKAKLDSGNYNGLTKDDIIGDLTYIAAFSYYVDSDDIDYLQAHAMKVATLRLPSEAVFSMMVDVKEFFGSPVSVSANGLFMDVDRAISANVALDGNAEQVKQFMITSGMNGSALEHSIPEKLFSTPEDPTKGISTVKALQIASQQGIPIYTITKDNISSILPLLQLDTEEINDIQNAVNAGKEVTVSQTNINFNGWVVSGYIVMDPVTGAAGYMISGGIGGGLAKAILWASTSLLGYALTAATGPLGLILANILTSTIQLIGVRMIDCWVEHRLNSECVFDFSGKNISLFILDIVIQSALGTVGLKQVKINPKVIDVIVNTITSVKATILDWLLFFI